MCQLLQFFTSRAIEVGERPQAITSSSAPMPVALTAWRSKRRWLTASVARPLWLKFSRMRAA